MFFEKQGSGPPVVLVHGLGAYSFSWRDTVAALNGDHTTYAVDLLGFGQSPAPPGFPNTMAAQADAVSAFIRAQGLADPVLIGHSMGGGISLRVAEQAGKGVQPNIKKMVLIAPAAYPRGPASGFDLGRMSNLLNSPDFDPSRLSRDLVLQSLNKSYANSSRITSELIDSYAKGLSSRSQLRAFMEHSSRLNEVAVPETRLGGITTETLIIWGEKDRVLDYEEKLGEKLQAALANAKLQTIKDCGHIPHEEQPSKTNKLIRDFL